ncbi:unnamed protein product [Vitrella brassicaformis CCMP3155]|uniref:NUP210 Ig-like domain-containing protein n=1 Tax=Vitrella brassicaformis (strain CCMP3155) TaxID=1169540 RepID=A0A0G4F0Y3_VITBC|nr:unnamed protein product [Vitrella brassicaformis CCMP3155]|eukprot:CEM05184.1 unnamed protein product [Vitrella brassicaformis CCMP3155]
MQSSGGHFSRSLIAIILVLGWVILSACVPLKDFSLHLPSPLILLPYSSPGHRVSVPLQLHVKLPPYAREPTYCVCYRWRVQHDEWVEVVDQASGQRVAGRRVCKPAEYEGSPLLEVGEDAVRVHETILAQVAQEMHDKFPAMDEGKRLALLQSILQKRSTRLDVEVDTPSSAQPGDKCVASTTATAPASTSGKATTGRRSHSVQVYLGLVHELFLETRTKVIYLGEVETASAQGRDAAGNWFSSLDGLELQWTVTSILSPNEKNKDTEVFEVAQNGTAHHARGPGPVNVTLLNSTLLLQSLAIGRAKVRAQLSASDYLIAPSLLPLPPSLPLPSHEVIYRVLEEYEILPHTLRMPTYGQFQYQVYLPRRNTSDGSPALVPSRRLSLVPPALPRDGPDAKRLMEGKLRGEGGGDELGLAFDWRVMRSLGVGNETPPIDLEATTGNVTALQPGKADIMALDPRVHLDESDGEEVLAESPRGRVEVYEPQSMDVVMTHLPIPQDILKTTGLLADYDTRLWGYLARQEGGREDHLPLAYPLTSPVLDEWIEGYFAANITEGRSPLLGGLPPRRLPRLEEEENTSFSASDGRLRLIRGSYYLLWVRLWGVDRDGEGVNLYVPQNYHFDYDLTVGHPVDVDQPPPLEVLAAAPNKAWLLVHAFGNEELALDFRFTHLTNMFRYAAAPIPSHPPFPPLACRRHLRILEPASASIPARVTPISPIPLPPEVLLPPEHSLRADLDHIDANGGYDVHTTCQDMRGVRNVEDVCQVDIDTSRGDAFSAKLSIRADTREGVCYVRVTVRTGSGEEGAKGVYVASQRRFETFRLAVMVKKIEGVHITVPSPLLRINRSTIATVYGYVGVPTWAALLATKRTLQSFPATLPPPRPSWPGTYTDSYFYHYFDPAFIIEDATYPDMTVRRLVHFYEAIGYAFVPIFERDGEMSGTHYFLAAKGQLILTHMGDEGRKTVAAFADRYGRVNASHIESQDLPEHLQSRPEAFVNITSHTLGDVMLEGSLISPAPDPSRYLAPRPVFSKQDMRIYDRTDARFRLQDFVTLPLHNVRWALGDGAAVNETEEIGTSVAEYLGERVGVETAVTDTMLLTSPLFTKVAAGGSSPRLKALGRLVMFAMGEDEGAGAGPPPLTGGLATFATLLLCRVQQLDHAATPRPFYRGYSLVDLDLPPPPTAPSVVPSLPPPPSRTSLDDTSVAVALSLLRTQVRMIGVGDSLTVPVLGGPPSHPSFRRKIRVAANTSVAAVPPLSSEKERLQHPLAVEVLANVSDEVVRCGNEHRRSDLCVMSTKRIGEMLRTEVVAEMPPGDDGDVVVKVTCKQEAEVVEVDIDVIAEALPNAPGPPITPREVSERGRLVVGCSFPVGMEVYHYPYTLLTNASHAAANRRSLARGIAEGGVRQCAARRDAVVVGRGVVLDCGDDRPFPFVLVPFDKYGYGIANISSHSPHWTFDTLQAPPTHPHPSLAAAAPAPAPSLPQTFPTTSNVTIDIDPLAGVHIDRGNEGECFIGQLFPRPSPFYTYPPLSSVCPFANRRDTDGRREDPTAFGLQGRYDGGASSRVPVEIQPPFRLVSPSDRRLVLLPRNHTYEIELQLEVNLDKLQRILQRQAPANMTKPRTPRFRLVVITNATDVAYAEALVDPVWFSLGGAVGRGKPLTLPDRRVDVALVGARPSVRQRGTLRHDYDFGVSVAAGGGDRVRLQYIVGVRSDGIGVAAIDVRVEPALEEDQDGTIVDSNRMSPVDCRPSEMRHLHEDDLHYLVYFPFCASQLRFEVMVDTPGGVVVQETKPTGQGGRAISLPHFFEVDLMEGKRKVLTASLVTRQGYPYTIGHLPLPLGNVHSSQGNTSIPVPHTSPLCHYQWTIAAPQHLQFDKPPPPLNASLPLSAAILTPSFYSTPTSKGTAGNSNVSRVSVGGVGLVAVPVIGRQPGRSAVQVEAICASSIGRLVRYFSDESAARRAIGRGMGEGEGELGGDDKDSILGAMAVGEAMRDIVLPKRYVSAGEVEVLLVPPIPRPMSPSDHRHPGRQQDREYHVTVPPSSQISIFLESFAYMHPYTYHFTARAGGDFNLSLVEKHRPNAFLAGNSHIPADPEAAEAVTAFCDTLQEKIALLWDANRTHTSHTHHGKVVNMVLEWSDRWEGIATTDQQAVVEWLLRDETLVERSRAVQSVYQRLYRVEDDSHGSYVSDPRVRVALHVKVEADTPEVRRGRGGGQHRGITLRLQTSVKLHLMFTTKAMNGGKGRAPLALETPQLERLFWVKLAPIGGVEMTPRYRFIRPHRLASHPSPTHVTLDDRPLKMWHQPFTLVAPAVDNPAASLPLLTLQLPVYLGEDAERWSGSTNFWGDEYWGGLQWYRLRLVDPRGQHLEPPMSSRLGITSSHPSVLAVTAIHQEEGEFSIGVEARSQGCASLVVHLTPSPTTTTTIQPHVPSATHLSLDAPFNPKFLDVLRVCVGAPMHPDDIYFHPLDPPPAVHPREPAAAAEDVKTRQDGREETEVDRGEWGARRYERRERLPRAAGWMVWAHEKAAAGMEWACDAATGRVSLDVGHTKNLTSSATHKPNATRDAQGATIQLSCESSYFGFAVYWCLYMVFMLPLFAVIVLALLALSLCCPFLNIPLIIQALLTATGRIIGAVISSVSTAGSGAYRSIERAVLSLTRRAAGQEPVRTWRRDDMKETDQTPATDPYSTRWERSTPGYVPRSPLPPQPPPTIHPITSRSPPPMFGSTGDLRHRRSQAASVPPTMTDRGRGSRLPPPGGAPAAAAASAAGEDRGGGGAADAPAAAAAAAAAVGYGDMYHHGGGLF